MSSVAVDEIYRTHIERLSQQERLELLGRIAAGLADPPKPRRKRRIMDFHGVGAETWKGVDAQKYIDEQRDEWDRKP